MRRILLAPLLLLLAVAVSLGDEEGKEKELPGPFRPYNVTGKYGERTIKDLGGKDKEVEGQFHCLVCENGLNPVAMVIARDINLAEPPEGLVELLQQLNAAVQKNRRARLGSFAVFLSDDLADVVTDDEKRFELAGKLKNLDTAAKLERGEHLPLALESKKYLAHYALDDRAAVTVILYNRHKVKAVFTLPANELADKKVVEPILAKLKEMLPPVR